MNATALGATAVLVESTVEFSAIALIALTAAAMLRRQPAALRHWILASAVAATAIAPVLGWVVPSWQVPVQTAPAAALERLRVPDARSVTGTDEHTAVSEADVTPGPAASVPRIALAIWVLGTALSLAVLLVGWCRLAFIRSRACPIRSGVWPQMANDISRAYGLRRPVLLLQSDHPNLLVTWGIFRPKVILPRAAQGWLDERIHIVLAHELAHVERGDWVVQIGAELVRAVYWFNPLAWLVCRQIRQESEQAADDAVLNSGVSGPDYAQHLLDVARAVTRRGTFWSPAPAIVRPSTLERRIKAMLNPRLNRTPLRRPAQVLSLVAVLAIASLVAAAQGSMATLTGAVLDPMNRTLPNATLVLTNVQTQEKHEVRSDETGRFQFSDLPSGDYTLEVKQPGFKPLRGTVKLTGGIVQQTLNLEVGTLQETINVTPNGTATPRDPDKERAAEQFRRKREQEALTCTSTPHGGNIRPPAKLVHVSPTYPLHLGQSGVGGTVLLAAVIAKDGSIKEARVTRSAHPDLDAAALTAVRQWRFDATLLNCMPIEVTMNVTVNFRAS